MHVCIHPRMQGEAMLLVQALLQALRCVAIRAAPPCALLLSPPCLPNGAPATLEPPPPRPASNVYRGASVPGSKPCRAPSGACILCPHSASLPLPALSQAAVLGVTSQVQPELRPTWGTAHAGHGPTWTSAHTAHGLGQCALEPHKGCSACGAGSQGGECAVRAELVASVQAALAVVLWGVVAGGAAWGLGAGSAAARQRQRMGQQQQVQAQQQQQQQQQQERSTEQCLPSSPMHKSPPGAPAAATLAACSLKEAPTCPPPLTPAAAGLGPGAPAAAQVRQPYCYGPAVTPVCTCIRLLGRAAQTGACAALLCWSAAELLRLAVWTVCVFLPGGIPTGRAALLSGTTDGAFAGEGLGVSLEAPSGSEPTLSYLMSHFAAGRFASAATATAAPGPVLGRRLCILGYWGAVLGMALAAQVGGGAGWSSLPAPFLPAWMPGICSLACLGGATLPGEPRTACLNRTAQTVPRQLISPTLVEPYPTLPDNPTRPGRCPTAWTVPHVAGPPRAGMWVICHGYHMVHRVDFD